MKKLLLALPLLLSLAAVAYVVPSRSAAFRTAAAAGGVSKTSLVAWYDFADATDAHASFDLTETATAPAYTAGPPSYGSALATTVGWSQSSLPNSWLDTEKDATFAIRFRPNDGDAAINYLFASHNGLAGMRWTSSQLRCYLAGATYIATSSEPTEDAWNLVIVQYVAATDTLSAWINNGSEASTTQTYSDASTATYIGGSSTTAMANIDFDWAGFWNRTLTSDERTWLYNSGGTRTYSELSD